MNQWFRSWHGAPTDQKWSLIAKKADVPTSLVVAFIWALMDRASQSSDRGSFAGVDLEVMADYLNCDETQLKRIVTQCNARNVTCDDRFVSWEKRQPKREDDTSTNRVRKFRKLQKEQSLSDDETQCNAVKRNETLDKIREDKNIDKEKYKKENQPLAALAEFDEFYKFYPKKVGKGQAVKAWRSAIKKASAEQIIAGLRRFDFNPDRQYVPNPATWLNGERWADETSRPDEPVIPLFDPATHQENLDRILGRTKANA